VARGVGSRAGGNVSTKIDTLEPNGEPLAVLLASIIARISSPDFISLHAIGSDSAHGDIARHAARAIAGVPLGIGQRGNRIDVTAILRLFAAAGIGAGAQFLQRARRAIAAAVPVLRDIGDSALRRLRETGTPALQQALSAISGNPRRKLAAGLGLAGLGLALVLVFVSGRHGRLLSPSDEGAPSQAQGSGAVQFAEDRPLRDAKDEFTRANVRYCTFQQIRLEALGPITEGADLVVFNALVDDWNGRCAKDRYRAEDKEAVDAEAGRRRALLEVEGRALVNVWRRKIVTTVQQRPTPASLDAGDATATTLAAPEQTNDATDQLPLLITLGRATADESDRVFPLKSPSLALVRGDVATRVQRRLNELGYTIAPIDGTWGPASRAALGRFKRANGLLRNDAFDAETVTRLFSTSAVTAAADPHKDESTIVETVYPPPAAADMNPLNRADGQRIQQRLADLGYYNGVGNGVWDAASRAALRRFKAANGARNSEDWDDTTETVLLDAQAVRADAAPSDARKSVTPPVAVPLPPKRPPPPAKAAEPTAVTATRGAPRPSGAVPTPPRISGTATR
jgi:peptidoglycan hydrolase-like protein with peptidoglycan-binding domain